MPFDLAHKGDIVFAPAGAEESVDEFIQSPAYIKVTVAHIKKTPAPLKGRGF